MNGKLGETVGDGGVGEGREIFNEKLNWRRTLERRRQTTNGGGGGAAGCGGRSWGRKKEKGGAGG